MYFWRGDNFKRLDSLALEADQAGFRHFAEYCRLREKGLRKKALEALSFFIGEMQAATISDRRKFIEWHQARCFLYPYDRDVTPTPLEQKIIQPTIKEWIIEQPNDPAVLRWSSDILEIRRAAEMNPLDDVAAIRFANIVLKGIDYTTHELPYGYLGDDPFEDLADVEWVLQHLVHIKSAALGDSLKEEAMRLKKLLQDYLARTKNVMRGFAE